jgi:ABC-type nitrate/sulfonate/bicarbonate transport system substrate-binding protein
MAGFYQAKATGLYEKAGLDVTLKMGGPQVNGAQLLLAGETDFMMGYDLQVLKMLEQGLPVITVGTSFQFDLQASWPTTTSRAWAISRTRRSWWRRRAARPGGHG